MVEELEKKEMINKIIKIKFRIVNYLGLVTYVVYVNFNAFRTFKDEILGELVRHFTGGFDRLQNMLEDNVEQVKGQVVVIGYDWL